MVNQFLSFNWKPKKPALVILGFMVILTDLFRGKMIDPFKVSTEKLVEFVKIETDWENKLKKDWEAVRVYAEGHGAKTFGAIGNPKCTFWLLSTFGYSLFLGTCWGTYVVHRLCSDVHFRAGISLHPSHTPVVAMLGEDEEKVLKEVKCPQMYMPAGEPIKEIRNYDTMIGNSQNTNCPLFR